MQFSFVFYGGILNINKITKNNIVTIIKSCILTLLLTSLVWVPFFKFEILNRNPVYTPAVSKSFYNGFSIFRIIKQVLLNKVTSQLSLFSVIGLILGIIFYIKLNYSLRKMLWISVFILFLCSSIFPWQVIPQVIIKFFKLFQSPQRFYILPQILLSYLFTVIIVKYINYKWSLDMMACCVIILAVFSQLLGQDRRVMSHRYSPIITRSYFDKARNKGMHLYGAAPYRVTHTNQFKYILNSKLSPCVDYYPKDALKVSSLINNNEAFTKDKSFYVRHNGYNAFSFYSPKKVHSVALPLFDYHGENLRVCINHHLIHYHINRDSLVTINKSNKGFNKITINYIPTLFLVVLKDILFILGIIWLIWYWIRYDNKLHY